MEFSLVLVVLYKRVVTLFIKWRVYFLRPKKLIGHLLALGKKCALKLIETAVRQQKKRELQTLVQTNMTEQNSTLKINIRLQHVRKNPV
jgi:hypothetical protein